MSTEDINGRDDDLEADRGRVTIINGGTQGLGEAVARRLVADGIGPQGGLVLAGRSAERGARLADELSEMMTARDAGAIFVQADIAEIETPTRLVDVCRDRFGTVHGVVNVAALTSRAHLWEDTPEHFDAMMRVNVGGPYFLIQAATRLMIRTGATGSIVNVGSVAGAGGPPKLAAYSASKAALAVLTRNLAFTLLPHRIRVNQVNPGWMDTESEHWTQVRHDGADDDWLARAEATRPLGRLVKPWEVANAIAFCLSPDSGVMTGASIDIEQAVLGAGDLHVPTLADVPSPDD